jgi:hypothetical protein
MFGQNVSNTASTFNEDISTKNVPTLAPRRRPCWRSMQELPGFTGNNKFFAFSINGK